jgi:hypothetical protein
MVYLLRKRDVAVLFLGTLMAISSGIGTVLWQMHVKFERSSIVLVS